MDTLGRDRGGRGGGTAGDAGVAGGGTVTAAARPPRSLVAAWSAIGAGLLGVVVYQALHPVQRSPVPGSAAAGPSAPAVTLPARRSSAPQASVSASPAVPSRV